MVERSSAADASARSTSVQSSPVASGASAGVVACAPAGSGVGDISSGEATCGVVVCTGAGSSLGATTTGAAPTLCGRICGRAGTTSDIFLGGVVLCSQECPHRGDCAAEDHDEEEQEARKEHRAEHPTDEDDCGDLQLDHRRLLGLRQSGFCNGAKRDRNASLLTISVTCSCPRISREYALVSIRALAPRRPRQQSRDL